MTNPKIIKHVEQNSTSSNMSEFIKRLILFEESEAAGHKWKDEYQKLINQYLEKEDENNKT